MGVNKMKKLLIFLALLFFPPFIALAGPVPDTGQTGCYDADGNEITPCPAPGEDFYGQDAQYSMYPQSYTKLDEDGLDLPDSATEWVMVRDNITGLIWEVKTDDGSIHDKDNEYDWYDAQDVFIATLNSQQFGGYNDWRLPSIKELSFIRNLDDYNPVINTTYFPNMLPQFWSSTECDYNTAHAWLVDFFIGLVDGDAKTSTHYVIAVHG